MRHQCGFLVVAVLATAGFMIVSSGCRRTSDDVFVTPQAAQDAAGSDVADPSPRAFVPPAAKAEGIRIEVLSPEMNGRVPQTGSQVRFRIIGDMPADARPQVFLLDATGLSSNYWSMDCDRESDGTWSCGVQYGVGNDSGMRFGVRVLALADADCRAVGSVGPLPTGHIGASELISVVRE